jgi:hypothetical protein
MTMLELMPGGPAIDVVAIQLALTGTRAVVLNRPERLIAAAFILAGGGRQADVVTRLGISKAEVSRMHARICAMVDRTAA